MPHIHGTQQYGTSKSSKIFLAVEIATAMPLNRFTRRIILRASITSVILISVMFIVTYTIILAFVDNRVSFHQFTKLERGWLAHSDKGKKNNKLLSKLYDKHPDINESIFLPTQTEEKWRVEEWDDIFAEKPTCFQNAVFLIIITSSPDNWDRRKAIRETWCKLENHTLYSWQCVFLVGQSLHPPTQIMLDNEMLKHSDILQGSYIDSYRNLTKKVLHGLYWLSQSCPTRYVLKTDDDCYVNTPLLLTMLTRHNTVKHSMYIGNIFRSLDRRKVIRNSQNKWSVTFSEYPEAYYPPYASGTGYLLSADVVVDVVKKGRYLSSFVPNEDAFIGMVMQHLGVSSVHSSRFVINSSGWRDCNHLYLIVIHDVKPKQQYTMQETSLRAKEHCKASHVTTWD